MKLTESQLRKIISNEIKSVLRESNNSSHSKLASLIFEEDEKPADKEKSVSKSTGEYVSFDDKTNIKDVPAEEIYKQLVSKDPNAPVFAAIKSGLDWTNVDPVKCAEHFEGMGEKTFVARMKDLQGKIPETGLPKDKMPFLPGPKDAKGSVEDLKDILTPGGEYNVDFESKQRSGSSLSEAAIIHRWGKLAGILTEKVDPPAPNELKGSGDEESEKYLKSGLEDGNEKDDAVPFDAPGTVKASAAVPTQSNILIGKTLGFAIPKEAGGGGIAGGDLGAYASTDNEILDGHHRWAATMISNPNADMGTFMNIDLAKVGGGDKTTGLKQLTAIGNALGNPTKTK